MVFADIHSCKLENVLQSVGKLEIEEVRVACETIVLRGITLQDEQP